MANKYVRCDSHCKYPAYDKEEIDLKLQEIDTKIQEKADSTEVYSKETIDEVIDSIMQMYAYLEGEVTVEANNSNYVEVPYPIDFTVNNTYVISAMASPFTGSAVLQAGQVGSTATSEGTISQTALQTNPKVELHNDHIRIHFKNYITSSSKTFKYKIALMKQE